VSTKENIVVDITPQEFICGSQDYSMNISITNISGVPLNDLQIFNTLSAGREVKRIDDIETSNLTELEDKKRKFIRELEQAVESAYARHREKNLSYAQLFAYTLIEVVDMYASFFSKRKSQTATPVWAEEALRIDEWEDVERLEKDVISFESDDSFLRKAYSINKDKLKRVLSKLAEEQDKKFSRGVSLPPGSTIHFPYSFKAPHLLKLKKMDTSFKISYKKEGEEIVNTRTGIKRISVYPSEFSVPTGGMLGALLGYCIKQTLLSSSSNPFDLGVLGGSVILGLVISLLVSRKPDVSKSITVEDFTGGLIIGVLSGIYSESILAKLQALI